MAVVLLDFDGHYSYGSAYRPELMPPADYPGIEPDRIIGGIARAWWPFGIDFTLDQTAPHQHRVVFTSEDLGLNTGNYVRGYSLLNIWGKSPADDGGTRTEPYASYVGSRSAYADPNPGLASTAAHEIGHAAGLRHGTPSDRYAPLKEGSTSWRFSDVQAIAARHPSLHPTAEVTAAVADVQGRPWYGGQEIVLTNITQGSNSGGG